MKKTIILDFDGTFYMTPTPDIPKLEDAIDLSQLLLLKTKLKGSPHKKEILAMLDEKFAKLDKTKIGANLYNQNAGNRGNKSKTLIKEIMCKRISFSELLQKKERRTIVFCARALAQMMEPNGEGNHRVSGMLNLGLDITPEEISTFYRKYATINYKNVIPNTYIRQVIDAAKERGDNLVIYTDNSKENIKKNLRKVGYKEEDFDAIVDMFDCNGGMTKKMIEGRNAFKKIMAKEGISLNHAEFYDDNAKICEYIQKHFEIPSFCVKQDGLVDVSTGKKADEEKSETTMHKIGIQRNDSVDIRYIHSHEGCRRGVLRRLAEKTR